MTQQTLDEFERRRPLDRYERHGYAADDRVDAARALTAAPLGVPPLATDIPDEGESGEWWFEAWRLATYAVERAIVDGLGPTSGGERL